VVAVGRLLGQRDVNEIVCTHLSEAVVRRAKSCVAERRRWCRRD
jgi:hypothetical protein